MSCMYKFLIRYSKDENFPRAIDPLTIVSGKRNQGDFHGPFRGRQCTSMCLAALAWWHGQTPRGAFTRENIDGALESGDGLHTYLRLGLKVSAASDKRVALDDLPGSFTYKEFVFNRDSLAEAFALLYAADESERQNMVLLKSFLNRFTGSSFGVLITVGEYTHAVFFTNNGKWLVFDPHGNVPFKCYRSRKGATVWEFGTVDAVVGFLADIHLDDRYCQVIKPRFEAVEPEVKAADQSSLTLALSDIECNSTCFAEELDHAPNLEHSRAGGDTVGILISESRKLTKSLMAVSRDSGCFCSSDGEDNEDDGGYVSFMGGFGWD